MLFVKAISKSAPAHIPGEYFLLHWGCQPAHVLNAFQDSDSGDIGGILFAGGAVAQFRVGDAEIGTLLSGNLRVQRLKGDTLPLGLRLGWDWSGRLLRCFGICHHLLDERVALQSVRVNHFAVDDAPLCQVLPNLFRVDIAKGIFCITSIRYFYRQRAVDENCCLCILQSIEGTCNRACHPIHNAVVIIEPAIGMPPCLDLLTI